MGKIKAYIHELAELAAEILASDIKPELLDYVMEERITEEDEWNFYLGQKDLILQMALEILSDEDDEPWVDPAGGTHYPGEDSAAMYESEDLKMPSVKEFFGLN